MSDKMSSTRMRIVEEVGAARAAEPLRVGIPSPEGGITDPSRLRLRDQDGDPVPHQVLAVHRGPNGGIAWLDICCVLSLSASGATDLSVEFDSDDENPPPKDGRTDRQAAGVQVSHSEGVVRILNRGEEISIEMSPFAVSMPAKLSRAMASIVDHDGVQLTANAESARIIHEGPLFAEVHFEGTYSLPGARSPWGFEARVRVSAGSDELDLDIRIVNLGDRSTSELREWSVRCEVDSVRAVRCGAFDNVHEADPPVRLLHRGKSHARGIFAVSEVEGGENWRFVGEPDYLLRWDWSELEGRHATNWMSVHTGTGAVTVAAKQFTENFPADIQATSEAVVVSFWPASVEPLVLSQGAAKTRSIRLVPRDDPLAGIRANTPILAHVEDRREVAWAPGPRTLPYLPERYPNLEAHIREELFSWYNSGQSMGFYDYGDSVQGITTGPRTGYSANNEHDAIYALLLHFMRSGERAYLDSAIAYADHVRDIDFIHHSSVFAGEVNGLRAHGRNHIHYVSARTLDGPVRTSIDTGHVWTEGLVLLSQVLGDDRYLRTAMQVADGLLHLHRLGWTRPQPAPRNSGWPLIALSAVAGATGESTYLDVAKQIAHGAMKAQSADGRWLNRIGLADDYCAWQNAVLLVGIGRLLEQEPDSELEKGLLHGLASLVDSGRNPDGTFIYMTRFEYRWANRAGQVREALALGYQLTGDPKYLHAGLAGGSRWYRPRGSSAALSNDIAEWRGHLPFLAQAHKAGLLNDLGEESA